MLRSLGIFILALLVSAKPLIAQTCFAQSQYRFQHFDTKDGLADDYVFSIAQDSLGYMWFQNPDVITRFDGNNFKVFKHNPDDSLRSALDFLLGPLFTDGAGNIWIPEHHAGGRNKGSLFKLAKYDRTTDGFIKFEIDLKDAILDRVFVEKDGSLAWFGVNQKALFGYNFKTRETANYFNLGPDGKPQRPFTVCDFKDLGSSFLLATGFGLWIFDKATKTFTRPLVNPRDSAFLYNTYFFAMQKKSNGELWLLANQSPTQLAGELVKIEPDFSISQRKKFHSGFNMSSVDIDEEGVFWFGTWEDGLYRFDPRDSSFTNIRNVPGDTNSLKSNGVNDVAIDRDQNVWVASAKGVSKLQRKTIGFLNLDHQVGGNTIYKTKNRDFLITSNNWNQTTQTREIFMAPIMPGQVAIKEFQKILMPLPGGDQPKFFKGKDHFWISSNVRGRGIFGFPINLKSEMMESGPLVRLRHDPSNPNTISTDEVGVIWEDDEGNLWANTMGSLSKIVRSIPYGEKGSVITYKHLDTDTNSISDYVIGQIYPEDETSFWVVMNAGVDLFHRDTQTFEHVFKNREMASIVSKTLDGTLFLGTVKGLYEAKKERGRYQFEKTPLWSKSEVNAIQEDRLGRLWLYTRIGLVCYDRKEKIAIEFNEDDGVLHAGEIEIGHLQISGGVMIMADPEGLSLFDPSTLTIDRKKTKPLLTKLEINNKIPLMGKHANGTDDFLMTADISMLDELIIDYQHNNFMLEFSAMEMTAPEKNLYKHKLEGYDKDWIETDYRNRSATYTNLDAGHYTFKVMASNHHGIWSDQETTLSVVVLPPPWKTTWAYAGYGLLFIGLLYGARRTIVQRERLKSNLQLAKVEQEKEHIELEKAQEVDRVKTSFFTNISHEFRTPLTLIKGPVQNIIEEFVSGQKEIDKQKVVEQLKLVQRNSDHLLKLINQLLDLARLESGSLKIEKSEGDLYSFIRAIASSFESFARQKNVNIEIDVPALNQPALFDKDKLETILINLINNAIKFTPAGGAISVTAEVISDQPITNNQQLALRVKDTGIGIPEDQQHKIFERFHQVSEAHKEVGTGIGLSLVKELINLMGGSISVKSEVEKGSEFKVVLPVEIIPVTDEKSKSTVSLRPSKTDTTLSETDAQDFDNLTTNNQQPTTKNDQDSTKPHVLVVEDNADIRAFIIDSLGGEFYFLEAENGRIGLEVAIKEIPDLIISDVMMPEMDGITMATKIKKDIRTSHIPLILLTAKSTEDSKLSGLQSGADDYLTKPFNKNELLLKVRNGVSRQLKLREKLRAELMSTAPKVEVLSEDEQFLNNVKDKILERLNDEQLSVESLAEDIGMSRVQLYRKISGLTDISVNELIRKLRLQRAAQLLQQNWGPVSQVAYEVGFSNLSYFSKVFKEEFGVLPSEYAEKG